MSETKTKQPYRVLARKYRPANFDALIGQDALVRTLTNAIESGRIAHAYMLTGIRGTGKTTTARIIAKALNYKGADGKAGPTAGSTDDCEICEAITQDRHPDVMEMDAASRTGVDDIREILDGVRYAPVSARYKVYIIDEVHMLSKNAFNALLKTLEEPPEHVIFIFATTEIRKVPVTVLSRCQRFDLRRIDAQTLADYYGTIAEKEDVKIEKDALLMLGRAADGSVRDGLSLLDQAIANGSFDADGNKGDTITTAQLQDMLGLADRTIVVGILEHALKGECAVSLARMADLYEKAADPVVVLGDMLDLTHAMTRFRAIPDDKGAQDEMMGADLSKRLRDLAGSLSMPALGRTWQILLKGLQEVTHAPNPQNAAEMVLIRLAYTADLPDPAMLLKTLKDDVGAGLPSAPSTSTPAAAATTSQAAAPTNVPSGGSQTAVQTQTEHAPETMPETVAVAQNISAPQTLEDIEACLQHAGEIRLASELFHGVHLVSLKGVQLEIRLEETVRAEFLGLLTQTLRAATEENWIVSTSKAQGSPTLAETLAERQVQDIEAAKKNPVIANVLEFFPNAHLNIKKNDEL